MVRDEASLFSFPALKIEELLPPELFSWMSISIGIEGLITMSGACSINESCKSLVCFRIIAAVFAYFMSCCLLRNFRKYFMSY
jgi:hypothetical protein